jgi:hypothetical protein
MSSMMSNPLYVKPLSCGLVAAALDKYALGQPDLKKSLYFGGSVAVGEAVATLSAPLVPNLIPLDLGNAIDGKTVSGRVMEVSLATGASWGINKYLLKNEISREDWTRRLAVIAAASFAGEYISDYLVGNPLSYFK